MRTGSSFRWALGGCRRLAPQHAAHQRVVGRRLETLGRVASGDGGKAAAQGRGRQPRAPPAFTAAGLRLRRRSSSVSL